MVTNIKLTFEFLVHLDRRYPLLKRYAETHINRDRRTLERTYAGVSVSPLAASERQDGGRIFRDSGEWAKNCTYRCTGGNMGARNKEGKREGLNTPVNKRLALRGYIYTYIYLLSDLP